MEIFSGHAIFPLGFDPDFIKRSLIYMKYFIYGLWIWLLILSF